MGCLYDRTKQWDAAESAYRESARLAESLGDLAGAAKTYNNLALVMENDGRLKEAEAWFLRGMEGSMEAGDQLNVSRAANNLANLLQDDPARLPEARRLAEHALEIKKNSIPALRKSGIPTIFSPKSPTRKRGPAASARRKRPR